MISVEQRRGGGGRTFPRDIGPAAQDRGGLRVHGREREKRSYLVWVSHEHVLSLRLFHTQIDDRPHDTPPVGERDIQLTSEVQRSI